MPEFTAAKEFLANQHLAPLLSAVQQQLVSLNKWNNVGQALQVRNSDVTSTTMPHNVSVFGVW